jgi:GTP pyrophosphokinase
MCFENLRAKISNNLELDNKLIELAYQIAQKHHVGQVRKSGEEYITHPVAVAEIIESIGGGTTMICAALLHDIFEDSENLEQAQDDIYENFNFEVFFIVEALTKDNSIICSNQKQQNYFYKFEQKIAESPEVFFIKMADVLHNFSTISLLNQKKQEKWIEELENGYMPIFATHYHEMSKVYQEMYQKLTIILEKILDQYNN